MFSYFVSFDFWMMTFYFGFSLQALHSEQRGPEANLEPSDLHPVDSARPELPT